MKKTPTPAAKPAAKPVKKAAPKVATPPPTKSEKLAGELLKIQIEQLERSPTMRKSMGINLKDLKNAEKVYQRVIKKKNK